MGITTDFVNYVVADETSQHSDFRFYVEVLDSDGNPSLVNAFPQAEYVIADLDGNVLITKTIGSGITPETDKFFVQVDDLELDTAGDFQHQFVTYDVLGNRNDPVFLKPLRVKPTLKAPL